MTILIIGGTGKLGFAIAKTLQAQGHLVLLTSRRANPDSSPSSPYKNFHTVRFDWHDRSTFMYPFDYMQRYRAIMIPPSSPIDRVLLVVPISVDMLDHVQPFIEIAIEQGVERFVLVSGTPAEKGEPGLGKVHEYIAGRGVDWCVLRPSWYMENFATNYLVPIRDYDVVPSVAGDGRVPFISIDDIVRPACDALVDEKSHNREHKIVGPELLTYDQVAGIFSRVLGRPIKHRRESPEEHAKLYENVGLGKDDVDLLTKYDSGVARGTDEAIFENGDKIIGPKRLEEFVRENKGLWLRPRREIR